MTNRMKRVSMVLVGLALGLSAATDRVMGGEIYRCEVNGVKTFVDSLHNCPGGRAERVGGGQRAGAVESSPPVTGRSPARAAPAVPRVADSTCLNRKSVDRGELRHCLRDERRAEVRNIATARLAAMSAAFADFAAMPRREDGLLAKNTGGRPTAWCEDVFNDVMALRNLEVVDDEESAGPRWMDVRDSDGRPLRRAAEILDPDFKELNSNVGKVVSGYVTVRWRGTNQIVLRASAACTDYDPKNVRCARLPYVSMLVHETEFPVACNVKLVGRAYWPNWKDSMTPVRLNVPAAGPR